MNKNLKCITLYDKYYIYYININKKTIKYIFMYEFYDKFLLKFEINKLIIFDLITKFIIIFF